MTEQAKPDIGWAIVELMGHVRLGGYVTEEELFGTKLGRIDIPMVESGKTITQYFGGGSIYRVTPTTEHIAREVAAREQFQRPHRLELPSGAASDEEEEYEPDEMDMWVDEDGPYPQLETCEDCGQLVEECTCDRDADYYEPPEYEDEPDG